MREIYDENLQLYVLQMVKFKVDISKIVGEDFKYKDIANIINFLKLHGKLSNLNSELEITSAGELYYKDLLKKTGLNKKGPVIIPQYQFINRKIKKFDIYLANKSSR